MDFGQKSNVNLSEYFLIQKNEKDYVIAVEAHQRPLWILSSSKYFILFF